mgnify:CR=1 FL=1
MVDGTSMTSSGSSSKCAQVVLHVCTAVWTQWIRIRKAGAGVLKSDMPKQRIRTDACYIEKTDIVSYHKIFVSKNRRFPLLHNGLTVFHRLTK